MLRGDSSPARRRSGLLLVAIVGVLAATLVAYGNPGNMGLCGACFVRDIAGALGLHQGPAILRPEVPGLVLGALLFALISGRHVGRSGSNAVARFLLGCAMAVGALVFLGCPFRLLQRLGGGDLTAWAALPGFVVGVAIGRAFEQRGYSIGKTREVPLAIGLLGPLSVFATLLLFVATDALKGPGPGVAGAPAHAPWWLALAIGTVAGGALAASGFCAISSARQVFQGPRTMLVAAVVLVAAYGITSAAQGNFAVSYDGQAIAHGDWLWSTLALVLVGLCGALCGGCPVRLLVLTGEGNGDAFVAAAGLLVGGAFAHTLGLAAAPASALTAGGPPVAGKVAIVAGLVLVSIYGLVMRRPQKDA